MTDSVVLNDGTSFLVLNDGTSTVLLNEQTDAGINITGRHAIQQTAKRRRTKLIHVEFSFWLISSLIQRIKLLQFGSKLHPLGIYTDKLRESFVLPLTELRQKLKPLTKQALEELLESLVDDALNDPTWRFEFLYKMIKRLKNGSK